MSSLRTLYLVQYPEDTLLCFFHKSFIVWGFTLEPKIHIELKRELEDESGHYYLERRGLRQGQL